jgi:hypothetical protein
MLLAPIIYLGREKSDKLYLADILLGLGYL